MTDPLPPATDPQAPRPVARRPRFLRPPVQETPPPRADVVRAVVTTALLVALLSWAAYTMVDWDFEQGTVNRQLDAATRDLASAARTLDEYARRNGKPLAPAGGDQLADEFATFYAGLQGGSALALERGRQVRGDVFAPGRSRGEPLRHVVEGNAWAVVSRGPDRDWDLAIGTLREDIARGATSPASVAQAYDPTNGALSSGDLWVTSQGDASFGARQERP